MTDQQTTAKPRIGKLRVIVTLLLDGEEQTHEVLVIHPDKLRGEQAGQMLKLGVMQAVPLTYTTLWAWAACRRLGIVDKTINGHRFLNEVCVDLVTPDDEEPVDPTQPDPAAD